MKTLLALILGIAFLPQIFHGQTPSPTGTPAPVEDVDIGNVPTIEIWNLSEKPFTYDGKVVRIHFSARSPDVLEISDGRVSGHICIFHNGIWDYLRTIVPPEAKEWYGKISVHGNGPPVYVYARIAHEGSGHTATLLGRELQITMNKKVLHW